MRHIIAFRCRDIGQYPAKVFAAGYISQNNPAAGGHGPNISTGPGRHAAFTVAAGFALRRIDPAHTDHHLNRLSDPDIGPDRQCVPIHDPNNLRHNRTGQLVARTSRRRPRQNHQHGKQSQ